MSIYQGWKPVTPDVQQPAGTARKASAKPVIPAAPPPVHLRKSQPVNALLPRTAAWVASLPPDVRPVILPARFPRIANLLCAAWDDPPSCRRYLDDLLVDRRGGRKGFPLDVLNEIQVLSMHHGSLHAASGCQWELVDFERK